jgi:hypothetical protein
MGDEAANPARNDLLEGAKEIGEFLRDELGLKGVTTRRAFHLCESKQIPAGKLGGGWIGSRRVLRVHFEKLTGAD